MIVVGAMSLNRVIGSGKGLPWDVPEEYDHFLELIAGGTVIIGRRSYEIFGRTMTSARSIVVSRSWSSAPGASTYEADRGARLIVCPSIDEAIREAESYGGAFFSAGGAAIYSQTIPLADTMYLSYIKGHYEGDTYFPSFAEDEWAVERRDDHRRFEFVVYRRTKKAYLGSK
jgi:dihydrofolate reductase